MVPGPGTLTEADRERDSFGQAIEAEGRRWQERLVRAGDEVQEEHAPTDEWVTDERRQHHTKGAPRLRAQGVPVPPADRLRSWQLAL
jgi:hypothetical protein